MTPTIIKRAVWKHPQRPDREFLLARVERACFRWLDALTTKPWDGVDYLDAGTALKAMRVYVGGDPIMVGYDLTIFDVAPPPEERAAKRIGQAFNAGMTFDEYRSRCVEIIGQETNISPAVQAFSELIAYLMIHRAAFARALFPVTPDGQPRDLVMDGLLYTAIEALAKSTGQDFSNLLKPLKEPVSKIVQARAVPRPPEGRGN